MSRYVDSSRDVFYSYIFCYYVRSLTAKAKMEDDRGDGTAPRMNNTCVSWRGVFKSLTVVVFLDGHYTGGGYAQSDQNCSATTIGNGACDPENNNEDCGYDGGDCCDCSDDNYYYYFYYDSFPSSSSILCRDPDSDCVHPYIMYSECTDGILSWIGDGYCDASNNIESCDYDGGDCCECTCSDADYMCG